MLVDVDVLEGSWPGRFILVQYRPYEVLQLFKWLWQDVVRGQGRHFLIEELGRVLQVFPSLSVTGSAPRVPGSRDVWQVEVSGGRRSMWVPLGIMEASLAGRMLLRAGRV